MQRVSATWDIHECSYVVRSPFEAKDAIRGLPMHLRRWDSELRVWRVDATCIESLKARLRRVGFRLTVIEPADQGENGRDWVDEAFKQCPPSNRERLRRSLMAAFHPDAGGDEQIAKRINMVADGAA